ncbi:DUF1330 domain-containing protein [Burkholderia cenocepacia]|uniref:DUF1330 domain-containing protein n=1 Tax=Burkholderia cenocepacia TaxID=95486 RepID=UPI000F588EAB
MITFIVVEIRCDDTKRELFSSLSTRSIANHGGQIVIWGCAGQLNTADHLDRALIIQFPSKSAARQWYKSGESKSMCAIEDKNSDIRIILIG